MQTCDSENKTKLNMPAGVKTLYDDENENQLQRRHFNKSAISDIFLGDSSSSENFATSQNSPNPGKSCMLAGNDTNYIDQNETEKRHFHVPSENFVTPENNADEEIDSAAIMKSTETEGAGVKTYDDENENRLERRHFNKSAISDIFLGDSSSSENFATSQNSPNRGNSCILTGNGANYVDQNETEKRHFHVPSENFVTPENYADEEIDLAAIMKATQIETAEADRHLHGRRHFDDKTYSDIFCRYAQQ